MKSTKIKITATSSSIIGKAKEMKFVTIIDDEKAVTTWSLAGIARKSYENNIKQGKKCTLIDDFTLLEDYPELDNKTIAAKIVKDIEKARDAVKSYVRVVITKQEIP